MTLLVTPKKLLKVVKQNQIHWEWFITFLSIVTIVIAATGFFKPKLLPNWIGTTADKTVTITVEKDLRGNIKKTVETIKTNPGKTLWDWLSLLGVPITLSLLAYGLQQIQQKRDEEAAKEEALQLYIDRLSTLLVDKNLLAIATKINFEKTEKLSHTKEELDLLDSAVYVIRARTISILRRFKNDKERVANVVQFLVEGNLAGKLKLSLSGADLSGVRLNGADLSGADFSGANLSGAELREVTFSDTAYRSPSNFYSPSNLEQTKLTDVEAGDDRYHFANLSHANLSKAKLSKSWLHGVDLSFTNLCLADLSFARLPEANFDKANLRKAVFNKANLIEAHFKEANLISADFSYANLSFADLSDADLRGANLNGANLAEANLDGANLNGANLKNAYITGIKNFLPAQIKLTKNWGSAKYRAQHLSDPDIKKIFGLDDE